MSEGVRNITGRIGPVQELSTRPDPTRENLFFVFLLLRIRSVLRPRNLACLRAVHAFSCSDPTRVRNRRWRWVRTLVTLTAAISVSVPSQKSMRFIRVAATINLPLSFPFYSSTRFVRVAGAGRGRRSPHTASGAAISVRGVQGHPSELPDSDTDSRRDGDQGLERRASRQSAGGRLAKGLPGEKNACFPDSGAAPLFGQNISG